MTKFRKNRESYSLEFKRQVIAPVVSGEMSGHAAAKAFGIKGSMTVYRWLDQHEKILGTNFDPENNGMPKSKENEESLNAENVVLRKLLEQGKHPTKYILTVLKWSSRFA